MLKGYTTIRAKILLTFLIILTIGISIFTGVVLSNIKKSFKERVIGERELLVLTEVDRVYAYLRKIENTTHVIKTLPSIQGLIRAEDSGGIDSKDQSTYQQWRDQLEEIFVNMATVYPWLKSVRYMDENAREIVCVNVNRQGDRVFNENELQQKAVQDYFQKAVKMSKDEIGVSPINLSLEDIKQGEQQELVLRFGLTLYDARNQKFKGVVMVNADAEPLFDLGKRIEFGTFMILDGQGHRIYDPSKTLIETIQGELNYFNKFPEIKKILAVTDEKVYHDKEGRTFYIWKKLYLNKSESQKHLIFLSSIDEQDLFQPFNAIKDNILLSFLIITVFLSLAVFFIARSISGPLMRLAGSARNIRAGDLEADIDEDIKSRKDEIGDLAKALDDMMDYLIEANKHLEEKVAVRTKALERSNEDLQQFAYVASHDLQEPLRKIMMFGDLLIKEAGDRLEGDPKMYIERMQSAGNRMKRLIESLLQYSRVSTKQNLFEPVDLGSVVGEVLSVLDMRIKEANATVDVKDLPVINADRDQMYQLFQNLISNALKFSKPDQAPHVKISSRRIDEKKAEIMINDNGIGFDDKYEKKIFQPFERLHARFDYEGTGIGLAVCKRIVDRHQGDIHAESKEGQGTTFFVVLPYKQVV